VSQERPDFGGMTVNERLFASGLIAEFDAAINVGDRQAALDLLTHVGMSTSGAEASVDAILADPSTYGYPRSS
jgi:hypothetical protein